MNNLVPWSYLRLNDIKNEDIMKTYGEMTTEEQTELVVAAYVKRLPVEIQTAGHWIIHPYPIFQDHRYYRVAKTMPSVDWSQVHPDINHISTNSHEASFGTKGVQNKSEHGFWSTTQTESFYRIDGVIASYDRGTCDWQESLISRPEE